MEDHEQHPHIPDFVPPDMDALYGRAPADRVDQPVNQPQVPLRPAQRPAPSSAFRRSSGTDPDRWFSQPSGGGSTLGQALSGSGTPGTYVLSAIMVLVTLLVRALPPLGDAFVMTSGWIAREPWTLVTAVFYQGNSLIQLAFTVLFLIVLGRFLEPILGTRDFVVTFLTSGIGGNVLLCTIVFPAPVTGGDALWRFAGADGAIFGLLGAYLVLMVVTKKSPVPVLVLLGFNVIFFGLFPSVAWVSNVAGLAAGVLVVVSLVIGDRRGRRQLYVWLVPLLLLVIIALATMVLH